MYKQFIQSNPQIMMGKPTVKGTRITVELILEKLAAGETAEQLLEAHPRLTQPAIYAALALAAEALKAGNYQARLDQFTLVNAAIG